MIKLLNTSRCIIATFLVFMHIPCLLAQDGKLKEPIFIIKLNASTLVGIVNPAVEFRVFSKGRIQIERWGICAPENFLGTGYTCSLAFMYGEFRYYPKEVFRGFYCGIYMG